MIISKEEISGTIYSYYFLCTRKMWLYYHHINRETENEHITLGKHLDESSYIRENHSVHIDNICIDFVKKNVVSEIKKSNKNEHLAIAQVKYYLFKLKQKGVTDITGCINYPLQRRKTNVDLSASDEDEIEQNLTAIINILQGGMPSDNDLKQCKECAYFDLCKI